MSIMSDEVNYLIYRYLQESGYHHSAYSFGLESHVSQSNINGSLVPPGALINILQKGIQFIEGELCINDDGNLNENLETLGSIPLIDAVIPEALAERAATIYRLVSQKTELNKKLLSTNHFLQQSQNAEGVTLLHGHKSEVFSCSWHPSSKYLATGAADGIVGVWSVDGDNFKMLELNHGNKSKESSDITSIAWHIFKPDGQILATASAFDNAVRIWDKTGLLVTSLVGHKELVLSLKWNKNGSLLLSGGLDKKCIVWKSDNWKLLQEFECHSGSVVEADWQNNECFSSCSVDGSICICKVDCKDPIKRLAGHTDVVNCIHWDPSGNVLASCADDKLVKLWYFKENKDVDLSGHKKEVTQVRWSSTKFLASASYDATVRVWDADSAVCLHSFTQHVEPVNSISFHPSGSYLVSASLDGFVNIWNIQNGTCLLSRRSSAGVFEASWSPNGWFICVCLAEKVVKLYDVRKVFDS